ncbi:low temperature requirement protein A [Rhodococcus sp. HNM0569]|uniref:low temperature requirement protein A n=1 Tax=Rhodococcus sp. HNM0569 TaxID=2716340 RepID=UPI001469DB8B|nr:low temperature requirement protein A [Rhodococcus sp. HNM0569]NLU83416.1 low temperature requirement protein A [Rhodococcus sp. HNM0569]
MLELFFDLVFVFAVTRVTDLMADEPDGRNILHGVLAMAVLWWSWVGYAWLGNLVRADEGIVRVVMFTGMGAMFIAAITIPEAFDDLPGGLDGPLVFALAYFVVRLVHLVFFWFLSHDDPQLRRQLMRFAPSMAVGTVALVTASQLDGWPQTALWFVALAGDYLGTFLGGEGWRLRSVSHFAERHGVIVIVALGESIVAIGIGVAAVPVSWAVIVGCALGLIVSAMMWWSYFDVTSLAVEQAAQRARGTRLIKIARNCYSFLHLPMVIGIVMMSLGLKIVLHYVGDNSHYSLSDPLEGWPLVSLYGGSALYLLALSVFKAYGTRSHLPVQRVATAALLVALVPLVWHVPALASLGILASVLVALISFEMVTLDERRTEVRHGRE